MTGQAGERRRLWIKASRAFGACAASLLFVAIILLAGISIAEILAQRSSPTSWAVLGDVGQAFGVLTAVLSAFALAALVITFWMQLQELRTHRAELGSQRNALAQFILIKMSLEDQSLAAIWPLSYTELSEERRHQYLYINLVLQNIWFQSRIMSLTDAEVESHLRHLFKSPIIREYWHVTRLSRMSLLVQGTAEFRFSQVADEVWQEYESVLACSNSGPDQDPPKPEKPKRQREPPDRTLLLRDIAFSSHQRLSRNNDDTLVGRTASIDGKARFKFPRKVGAYHGKVPIGKFEYVWAANFRTAGTLLALAWWDAESAGYVSTYGQPTDSGDRSIVRVVELFMVTHNRYLVYLFYLTSIYSKIGKIKTLPNCF